MWRRGSAITRLKRPSLIILNCLWFNWFKKIYTYNTQLTRTGWKMLNLLFICHFHICSSKAEFKPRIMCYLEFCLSLIAVSLSFSFFDYSQCLSYFPLLECFIVSSLIGFASMYFEKLCSCHVLIVWPKYEHFHTWDYSLYFLVYTVWIYLWIDFFSFKNWNKL